MAQLDWGNGIGLHFKNDKEYYETLGFLAKNKSLYRKYLIWRKQKIYHF